MKRIAITGPESTGKSELTKYLANHFSTVCVPEFARQYIDMLGRPYSYNDVLEIAQGQQKNENQMIPIANEYLFCDTDSIVAKIWCDYKFGKCHQWIIDNIKNNPYDFYLLSNIDLPWQPDPLREHPDKRKVIFELYLDELKNRKLPFVIISGLGETRHTNAVNAIKDRFLVI